AAGAGTALTMPAATAAIMEAAPPERGGAASGVLNSGRQVGGVIGIALLGTLVSGAHFLSGLHVGLLIAAGAFAIGYGVAAGTASRATKSARRTALDSART